MSYEIDEALEALDKIRGRMCAEGGRVEEFHFENEGEFDAVRQALEQRQEWRSAMQEFVDRCERGEVLSKYTYAKFKELLAHSPGPEQDG